jgi:catechol 2,3-dioxygenase-like lactoylglutathione lyase family enzyme
MFTKALASTVFAAAAWTACGGFGGPEPQLLGDYSLAALDGAPPPAPSPDQPGMLVVSLSLALTEDRFELGSTFQLPGDTVQAAPLLTGRWERTAAELRFFPEQAAAGTTVVFEYAWDDERLVLTDARGHRWTMVRADSLSEVAAPAHTSVASAAVCRAPNARLFIDHLIFAVRDLPAAADSYRARGFTIKPGRLHPDGLLNAHIKFRSAQEIEFMSLARDPTSDIAEEYARILSDGEGGAYLALAVPDLEAAARAARTAGLRPAQRSSGSADFVSFPSDSAAMAVFFGARSSVIDPDSLLTHTNGAAGLEEIWIQGDEALARMLETLGAVRCGDVVRTARRGERFGLANGAVVLVPRAPGRRPRMLGGKLEGVAPNQAWIGVLG